MFTKRSKQFKSSDDRSKKKGISPTNKVEQEILKMIPPSPKLRIGETDKTSYERSEKEPSHYRNFRSGKWVSENTKGPIKNEDELIMKHFKDTYDPKDYTNGVYTGKKRNMLMKKKK